LVKHPQGNYLGIHVVVLGFNEKNECLVGGLDTSSKKTIPEVFQDLVSDYNGSQSPENQQLVSLEKNYPAQRKERIFKVLKDYPELINLALDENKLYKSYTVEEIQKLGGCKFINKNALRLSPLAISCLKDENCSENRFHTVAMAKAFSLAWSIHAVQE